ncbi:glucan biosynthesis protein [Mucilaginibacter sp. PPCGB 2223]|uniref:SMI1/KNR4 family protein n=1 Tax=Mucilaginibacter sp. PPCGB 2223 TaxID=1886027 RepID=UPI000826553D|nr:SMI1/KNR4 family protein [Mucilaginibacter sp. PPCGB 2223]OCX50864.1 glucan biosynthesis protein [Mucilaginibacter sp. PPCGB 2223]
MEQIERIRKKLKEAKIADKKLGVFGACNHKYIVNEPVTGAELTAFEQRYGVILPACYKSFLLHIGNGGYSYFDSSAGPFYGIYPLGKGADELVLEPEKYLQQQCILHPEMQKEEWNMLCRTINETENISDEDYEAELGKIYSGVLPIGSQGCTYIHAIVLTGPYAGKVVNLDLDRQHPKFTYENNFLDWYERWLDEVISGDLIKDTPSWFGYSIGGTDKILLERFFSTTNEKNKLDCLKGILSKSKIQPVTINTIEGVYPESAGEIRRILLELLTKFAYVKAKPFLVDYISIDIAHVFQCVFTYAKERSAEWRPIIEANMALINDPEAFRFCAYLLIEMKFDFGPLILPFITFDDRDIKVTAFYALGTLSNKRQYVDAFITGLHDKSNKVVHAALQALENVKDRKLIAHYRDLADRFPVEQDFVLVNLQLRLKEYGLTLDSLRTPQDIYLEQPSKKWFQFWK